jgi:glutathione synthase/RimK-type ligase-like ATP-grasp enzyme
MKKILILGTSHNYEVQGLEAACSKLGLSFTTKLFSDMKFHFPMSLSDLIEEIESYDHIVSRVEGQIAVQIRTFLLSNSKKIRDKMLNGHAYADYPILSKIQQYALFSQHGIPIPETWYQASYETPPQFPCIVKGIFGSKGEAVHLVKDEATFRGLEKQYGPGGFVVQTPLPIGEDYRIVVVGDRVLGFMKKIATDGFVTNIHAGGQATTVEPEREAVLTDLAIKAAKATGCQFGGVDVMFDADGQPRVLEINRGAAYAGFEQVNPLSVSEEILKYLIA